MNDCGNSTWAFAQRAPRLVLKLQPQGAAGLEETGQKAEEAAAVRGRKMR